MRISRTWLQPVARSRYVRHRGLGCKFGELSGTCLTNISAKLPIETGSGDGLKRRPTFSRIWFSELSIWADDIVAIRIIAVFVLDFCRFCANSRLARRRAGRMEPVLDGVGALAPFGAWVLFSIALLVCVRSWVRLFIRMVAQLRAALGGLVRACGLRRFILAGIGRRLRSRIGDGTLVIGSEESFGAILL